LILYFAILLSAGISIGLSYLLARFLATKFKQLGITGLDIHKPHKPVTAEMGGLAVLLGSGVGASVFYLLARPVPFVFFAAVLTILLVGVIGTIDDLFPLRQRYKPFLVAIMSAPLAYAFLGTTSIYLPLVGAIPFGILLPVFIVPLAVATSANLSNMLAGFNGLETGCTVIALAALTFLALLKGSEVGSIVGSLFLAGYLGFLVLNWYPAKIFPGDTGTLMAGTAIVTVGLISGLVFAAAVVSLPAGFDFALKISSKRPFAARSVHGNTRVTQEGVLTPPSYPALSHAFLRVSNMTEKGLVSSILAMEAVYAILAVALTIVL
jgi:UDP-N-acetylglucosamine--dolichyl-phosphate N-acetylglucosaminephosphotransferase